MRNFRMLLEYDGSKFHGWQMQPGVRTIQEELERSLGLVLRKPIVRLTASGRTDSGVHAWGQVANFFLDCDAQEVIDLHRLKHSVSRILIGEVSILDIQEVSSTFDARADAVRKQYSYLLLCREAPATINSDYVWHIGTHLDRARIAEEAKRLVGTHDFTSFRGNGCNAKNPVREIFESEICDEGECLRYRVIGAGFLKQMVRNIVGTLVAISRGRMGDVTVLDILARRDRRAAGMTAPAKGLYLDYVQYSDTMSTDSVDTTKGRRPSR